MMITSEQAKKIIERYKEAQEDDNDYMSFGQSANTITDILEILDIQYKFETKDYRNWEIIILNKGDAE